MATNWFALSELAGIDNVKLYPESMAGWSNAGYDMANVPGPVRSLWNQVKSAFWSSLRRHHMANSAVTASESGAASTLTLVALIGAALAIAIAVAVLLGVR